MYRNMIVSVMADELSLLLENGMGKKSTEGVFYSDILMNIDSNNFEVSLR
jgi:hypothetical protein